MLSTFSFVVCTRKIQGEPNCVVLVAPEDCSVDESILTASGFPKQTPMLVEIPTTPPRLKSQIPKYNEFWPCQYYEHIPDTRLVSELSDKEKQSFVRYMNETLDLAENSKLSVACCIVNMERNEVMGRGIEDDDAHCVMRAIEDAAAKLREKKLKMQKHCTDYVVFTNHEPCVMCSMALVHSRVRCVVFGTRCRDGGLSGEIRLGSMKQLNHRFDVYEGCCLERCQSIKKQCF